MVCGCGTLVVCVTGVALTTVVGKRDGMIEEDDDDGVAIVEEREVTRMLDGRCLVLVVELSQCILFAGGGPIAIDSIIHKL